MLTSVDGQTEDVSCRQPSQQRGLGWRRPGQGPWKQRDLEGWAGASEVVMGEPESWMPGWMKFREGSLSKQVWGAGKGWGRVLRFCLALVTVE